jgi:hypothetical protein
MNHVFVDFENGQQIDLSLIGNKAVSFTLLLGANQKLSGELAERLMEHAASLQFIRLTSSGRNALDFTLAYYIGRAAITDPTGYFHIISKDTGFDPLIEHLKSRHIEAHRHDDCTTLTLSHIGASQVKKAAVVVPKPAVVKPKAAIAAPKVAVAASPEDPMTRVLGQLRKNANSRPKREKTLKSQLLSLLKPVNESGVEALIAKLQKAKHLTIDAQGAVAYSLK